MTALAIGKTEIPSEISPAVVTGGAGLRTGSDEMLGRRGRTDLSSLRRARGEFVAVGTRESLACAMFCVTEGKTKSARVGAGRAIRFLVVTDSTRSDLAARI